MKKMIFSVLESSVSDLINQLEAQGVTSILVECEDDQEIFQSGVETVRFWQRNRVIAYVEDRSTWNAEAISFPYKEEEEFDLDWVRLTQEAIQVQQYGGKISIVPSWCSLPQDGTLPIFLDPGAAFGSGEHPTTRLCLEVLIEQNFLGKRVLDFGCGSGILMMAALKLGAEFASGVDIDEEAVKTTRANCQANSLFNYDLFLSGEKIKGTYDAIFSNILLNPLLGLKESFFSLLNKEGKLFVSGIIESQKNQLIDAYRELFVLEREEELSGWTLLGFRRA